MYIFRGATPAVLIFASLYNSQIDTFDSLAASYSIGVSQFDKVYSPT